MSDNETAPVIEKKRGRPKVEKKDVGKKDEISRKTEVQKRAASPKAPAKDDKSNSENGVLPAKRGRGRPKGSTKRSGGFKSKKTLPVTKPGRGRGRPKTKKDESSEENDDDEDEEEEDENNDEDENGTESD